MAERDARMQSNAIRNAFEKPNYGDSRITVTGAITPK